MMCIEFRPPSLLHSNIEMKFLDSVVNFIKTIRVMLSVCHTYSVLHGICHYFQLKYQITVNGNVHFLAEEG